MSIEHISKFITEVAIHFSPPKFDTKDERNAWLTSLHRSLDGADQRVLERAAQIIIDTRKNSRSFPLPAECRAAVTAAAYELEFDKHIQTLPELRQQRGSGRSKERDEFTLTLLKSPLGREAARDGWVLACFDFTAREQRLPDNRRYEPRNQKEREEYAGCSEVEFCKRAARGFDEAYDAVLRGGGGAAAGMLEKLGDSMAAKREKLRAEVLGR